MSNELKVSDVVYHIGDRHASATIIDINGDEATVRWYRGSTQIVRLDELRPFKKD